MPKLKNRLPKMAKSGNYAVVYYKRKMYRIGIWGMGGDKTILNCNRRLRIV